jgi:hypothetical protein
MQEFEILLRSFVTYNGKVDNFVLIVGECILLRMYYKMKTIKKHVKLVANEVVVFYCFYLDNFVVFLFKRDSAEPTTT